MKLFKELFKPYTNVRELQEENDKLRQEIAELKDTNESLWDMLEELKESEKEAIESFTLLTTEPVGEA